VTLNAGAKVNLQRFVGGGFVLAAASGALWLAMPAAADSGRGAALYENHCQVCHSKRVHQRDQRLPANLAELRSEVERWQKQQNLRWSDEDVADVVEYLNSTQYKF
jgi:mono/diheme cytochrome c family protein